MTNLPNPTGWRILVKLRDAPEKVGNILLSDQSKERMKLGTMVVEVASVGPTAYADSDKFISGPWCRAGDFVMIGRYAGSRFNVGGFEYRILNDDEILAIVSDPESVSAVI